MLIREIMHPNPITIDVKTKLNDAYKIMQEKGIRHLPVTESGKLAGIVTDRDLRLATSKLAVHPFDPDVQVNKIMSHPVECTNPNDPIEIATQLMRKLKIGCMPVLEGNKIIGIITAADILDAMLLLTGVHSPSGRLDVRTLDKPGELAKLANILSQRKINIYSILTYQEKNKKSRLILRVNTIDIRSLGKILCSEGFEVLWPPRISCPE